MAQYLQNHTGYERAWLGPWEHVRGNETDESGRLKMGRAGWFDEVMRFYDRFLKGADAGGRGPDDRGPDQRRHAGAPRRRGRRPTRPATRARCAPAPTPTTAPRARPARARPTGVWTISPPLPHDVHLAGSGRAVVDVSTTLPRANLVVDVYDLDENGRGPLITRQGHLIRSSGADHARPLVGRLEARRRPPDRASASPTPTPTGGCTRRPSRPSRSTAARSRLPFLTRRAHRDDRGRAGHAAAVVPGQARHRPGLDPQQLDVAGVPDTKVVAHAITSATMEA